MPLLTLIDASGFIFRAYHALPPLTAPDGTPAGAVYGFASMVLKQITEQQPSALGVVFDYARQTFRHTLYPDYKANRPETPPDLAPQFPLCREVCTAFNLPVIESAGFEADDLLASYAAAAVAAGYTVRIISADKDLMQLVSPAIELWDPIKNIPLDAAKVEEKFGVPPAQVIDVQALAGDSSDNVPGVPSIGIKTAAELIRQFGSLETLLARLDEIPQPKRRQALLDNQAAARLSRQLVTLKTDAPLPLPLEELARRPLQPTAAAHFLSRMGFRSLLARLTPETAGTPAPVALVAATPTNPNLRGGELITSVQRLQEVLTLAGQLGLLALDTETTSLDVQQATLVGVALALPGGWSGYVPLAHEATELGQAQPPNLPVDQVVALLRPVLLDAAVKKIAHHAKYDWHVLARYGLSVRGYDDTMLMSYAAHGSTHGHGLDELARLYLQHQNITYDELTKRGRERLTFAHVPVEQACAYAAEDAAVTLALYEVLIQHLQNARAWTVYQTLDLPLLTVLQEMEQAGIDIDASYLHMLRDDFSQRLQQLEQTIHQLAGVTFNVGSPKQLGEVLFETLRLPNGKKGKSGAYVTDVEVLENLADAGHAVPEKVLAWRQLAKLKSTYTESLLVRMVPPHNRVHSTFSQTITSTGRLSSSDPNLQNIPIRTEEGQKIRRAFVAPAGQVLLAADYSQIELRLLAEVAQVETLQQAFRDGADIHRLTASQVWQLPLASVTDEQRRRAKAINFGIIYGISAFGLARQLGCAQREAADIISSYFKQYPGIQAYMEATKQQARQQGYVATMFGRRCYTPDIASKNAAQRAFAERAAINAPLQGTAADLIKRAMIKLAARARDVCPAATLLLQVHDELVWRLPVDAVERWRAEVVTLMANAAAPAVSLRVPLVVDTSVGQTWGDL